MGMQPAGVSRPKRAPLRSLAPQDLSKLQRSRTMRKLFAELIDAQEQTALQERDNSSCVGHAVRFLDHSDSDEFELD